MADHHVLDGRGFCLCGARCRLQEKREAQTVMDDARSELLGTRWRGKEAEIRHPRAL